MTDLSDIVTVPALAEHLGMGVKTIMRAIDAGELRASQVARRGGWVIRRPDLDDWLDLRATRPAGPARPRARAIEPERAPARGRGQRHRGARNEGGVQVGADGSIRITKANA